MWKVGKKEVPAQAMSQSGDRTTTLPCSEAQKVFDRPSKMLSATLFLLYAFVCHIIEQVIY
jgi:hypothetical protein